MQTQVPAQVREPITRVGVPAAEPRAPGWLIALSVVLAVALVALGAWVIVDRTTSTPPPADEIVRILDDNLAAWNSGSADEVQAMYTDDALFYDTPPDGEALKVGGEEIGAYAASLHGLGFVVEPASTTTVVDDTAITAVRFGAGTDLTTSLGFIEVNADGLIVRQWLEPLRVAG